ncbi:MAG: APC family permease, partial [Alicyclobacillus sp.]|nr:APC family permease [Alicyclobacillus sp.]
MLPEASYEGIEKFGYVQQLKRSMGVSHLTAFGLNYMVPIAPAIIFGFLLQDSGGTVALPYLIAGVAMFFTALSYGVMVRNFPLAGSVYNYVGRGINPHVGFIAGWTLTLDYILIPTVTAMSSALYVQQIFPHIPYFLLLAVFSIGCGILNLFGVDLLAKLGLWLLAIGELVIFISFAVWGYAVVEHHVGVGTLFSWEPFRFHSLAGLFTASSLAVFSYLGFDAVSTLAEESHRPKVDVPRAIYWAVIIGAFTMFLHGYLGMLVIPGWANRIHDPNFLNTTLFQVAQMTGGPWFSRFYTAGYILELGVFNLVATAAGSRLLFGMGRDELLPKSVFAAIHRRWQTPHWNIVIIVCVEFVLGMVGNINVLSNLVNYGALFGFGMLNAAVVWLYYVRRKGLSPASEGEFEGWIP